MSASDWLDEDDAAAMAVAWRELVAQRAAARRSRARLAARATLSRIPAAWLEAATTAPCTHYTGATREVCGRRPTRLYLQGRRCWWHAPKTGPFARFTAPEVTHAA